jgi:uncharacterized membrane protein YbhN (UPF0104 family)
VSKLCRLLGSLALLAVLAWRLDWRHLGSAFAGLDVRLWLAALGVYLVAQFLGALRWQLVAGALGFGGSWRRYVSHLFIGMFFNLVLPTSVGGDVVRGWYLASSEGRRGAAYLSVLVDRLIGVVVLVAMACVAAACCPVPLPAWLVGVVVGLGGGALLGLLALPLLRRLPLGERWQRLVGVGGVYLRRPRLLLATMALSVAVQLAHMVLLWLIGLGLGLRVPLAYYGVLATLVALLTLLPISLNGMGLRELGTVVLLGPLGVDAARAVTLSVLQFAAFSAGSLVGGGLYLFGRFPRFAGRSPEGSAQQAEGREQEVGGPDVAPVHGAPAPGRVGQAVTAA